MLASLKIENVAVIEKAEVNFTSGFNVLTGETGAGKSILIDSIKVNIVIPDTFHFQEFQHFLLHLSCSYSELNESITQNYHSDTN